LSVRHEQGLRKNNRAENSHLNRHDGASARCSGSNRPDQSSASCPFTPPSKTRSTTNAISYLAARSASSETKHSGRGEPPLRREAQRAFQTSRHRNQVGVTAPKPQCSTPSSRTGSDQRHHRCFVQPLRPGNGRTAPAPRRSASPRVHLK
jgi:hypothetical protein